ncbi:mechanosensitive ion channel family protein [Polaribacter glomeratus]|uniref:Mechanosensitive ion channel n=1 Tax=Polaribacter glomeratus TaxID=102 RepID=A0A2S7WUP6_9FLAO|nr:mechanosensitive ion channel domain-containing protein [Polaribacter glomeratus]PQJ81320.1 hypothetical protein BTO16_01435 [Polaribacter glomeratus]TXD64065.1 mechanosensitive ion channel [Polaribacter glomeratus]
MEEINSMFQRLKSELLELIPNMLVSLIVLAIGYIIARLVKSLVAYFFRYLGKLVSRKFSNQNFTQAGSFLGTAFFWLIIFSSILLITDILGLTILTNWFQSIIQYIPNILAAILIVFVSIMLGNLVSDLIASFSKRKGFQYSITLVRFIRFLLLSVAIIIALDQIGIEISLLIDIIDIAFAALLFGAALAFGLGARTSISNILACYYVRKRYKEGDEVQIGKTRGKIIKIDTTTVILENEIGELTIPAKEFNETKSYLIK